MNSEGGGSHWSWQGQGEGGGTSEVGNIRRHFRMSHGESVLLSSGREGTRAQLDILQST